MTSAHVYIHSGALPECMYLPIGLLSFTHPVQDVALHHRVGQALRIRTAAAATAARSGTSGAGVVGPETLASLGKKRSQVLLAPGSDGLLLGHDAPCLLVEVQVLPRETSSGLVCGSVPHLGAGADQLLVRVTVDVVLPVVVLAVSARHYIYTLDNLPGGWSAGEESVARRGDHRPAPRKESSSAAPVRIGTQARLQ